MESETINQAYTFAVFIINGLYIGLLFDVFRILRKSFQTSDWITYIEDILFWILTGISLLYTIFIFNHGSLRLYLFIAIACGILLYMLLFSKIVISISVKIIKLMKYILQKILSIICYPFKRIYQIFKKILFKPISFVFINFRNFTSKKIRLCSKIVKNNIFFRKKEGKQA